MFSILGPDLTDLVLVDLCCGAGGLGIEALSRGARRAVLVDSARSSLEVARANLELCGADPGAFELVRADGLAWLARWEPPETPWAVLADPPYDSPLAWSILSAVAGLAKGPGFRLAILEHDRSREPDPVLPAPLTLETRRYGQSALTILRLGCRGGAT